MFPWGKLSLHFTLSLVVFLKAQFLPTIISYIYQKFKENDKTFEFKKHVSTETSVIFS